MPTANIGDIQIYYEEHGQGPPLIMILGLGQDIATWESQIGKLSGHARLIVFDNRDTGKSSRCPVNYKTETMALDTLGLMDHLAIKAAHILGTSMGGMIAQHIALMAPARLNRLILASTTSWGEAWIKAFYGSWEEHLNKSGKTGDVPMVMPWLFSKPFRKQHPQRVKEIKERLTGHYLTRNSAGFERQLNANIGHDTRGRLHQIQVPTLIMVGKDDELTPPKMAEELSSEIPNSKLLIFDRGGHGLYWEIPDLFNEAVIDFIRQHGEDV